MSDWQWPKFNLKFLAFLQKVGYGGAVGKKAAITIVAMGVMAVALVCCWGLGRINPAYELAGIIGIGFIVVMVGVFFFGSMLSIDKTLKAHPLESLMDGAQRVAYERVMASKAI